MNKQTLVKVLGLCGLAMSLSATAAADSIASETLVTGHVDAVSCADGDPASSQQIPASLNSGAVITVKAEPNGSGGKSFVAFLPSNSPILQGLKPCGNADTVVVLSVR